MPGRKKKQALDELLDIAVNALSDRKAINPVVLDFRSLKGSLCDAFLICHGTSRVQVEAICEHLSAEIKRKTGLMPVHIEGLENAEWVLIDYFDLVVHIFQDTRRKFYNLEQLWADAETRQITYKV